MKVFSTLLAFTFGTLLVIAYAEETTTIVPLKLNETATEVESKNEATTTTETPPETSTSLSLDDVITTTTEETKSDDVEQDKDNKDKENKDKDDDIDDSDSSDKDKDEQVDFEAPNSNNAQLPSNAFPHHHQMPPKVLLVTQHVRDPISGVVYARQVPLIASGQPNHSPASFYPYPSPSGYPSSAQDGQPQLGYPPKQQPQAQSTTPFGYPPIGPPPQYQSPPQSQSPQYKPSQYDPLGSYNDVQKKRQFYQDMLASQLAKFQSEIEPMMEGEGVNATEKNDIEDLLGVVSDLRRSLESHQIFNISDVMNEWKEGKLNGGSAPPPPPRTQQPQPQPLPSQQRPHNVHYRPQSISEPQSSSQPATLRTLILIPNTRMMSSPTQRTPMTSSPQHHLMPPSPQDYPVVSRLPLPMLHIRRSSPSSARDSIDSGTLSVTGDLEVQQSQNYESRSRHPSAGPNNDEFVHSNEIFAF